MINETTGIENISKQAQLLEKIWVNKVYVKIIELILEGDSQAAIATQCGIHLSSIKRRIAFLKKKTHSKSLHGLSACLSRMECFHQPIMPSMQADALQFIKHQMQGVFNHETK